MSRWLGPVEAAKVVIASWKLTQALLRHHGKNSFVADSSQGFFASETFAGLPLLTQVLSLSRKILFLPNKEVGAISWNSLFWLIDWCDWLTRRRLFCYCDSSFSLQLLSIKSIPLHPSTSFRRYSLLLRSVEMKFHELSLPSLEKSVLPPCRWQLEGECGH